MPQKRTALSANLKALRKAKDLSQKGLGSLSGIRSTSIQNAERGIRELKADDLLALADSLNVSVDDLIRPKAEGTPRFKPTPQEALDVLREALEKPSLPAAVALRIDRIVKLCETPKGRARLDEALNSLKGESLAEPDDQVKKSSD